MLDSYVTNGDIVPAELTVKLLIKSMQRLNAKKYLIDGFPRSLEIAQYFEKSYGEIKMIFNFHAPDEVLVQRLLQRGKSSGRSDDNEETIKHRIQVILKRCNMLKGVLIL